MAPPSIARTRALALVFALAPALLGGQARADIILPSIEVCDKKQEGDPCKSQEGFGFGNEPELPGYCVKLHDERRNRDYLTCNHDLRAPPKSSQRPQASAAPSAVPSAVPSAEPSAAPAAPPSIAAPSPSPDPAAASPPPASSFVPRPPEIGARPAGCGCAMEASAPAWGRWLVLGSALLLLLRRDGKSPLRRRSGGGPPPQG